jgi:hypothetical protein
MRSTLSRLAAWSVVVCLVSSGCAQPLRSADPVPSQRPPVICKRCGEVPPPAGYDCAGQIMIRADVPTRQIAELERMCLNDARPAE